MNTALDAILGQPWALTPSVLRQITAYLSGDTSVRAAITTNAQPPQPRQAQGYIQIIPIRGGIERRSSLLAELLGVGTSIESIRTQFRAAISDPDVRGVLFDIDSPGGGVGGVTELAEEIRSARGSKPIFALADTTAGSAAYWLGAQADQFYVTPSGEVGSVGIFGVHLDLSRKLDADGVTPTIISAGPRKVAETELEPLTDEARAAVQARVDAYYDQFVNDVAKGRRVSAEVVRKEYGEGGTLLAKDALSAGMVDGIETMDGVLRRMTKAARRAAQPAAEGETVEPYAQDEDADLRPFRERVEMLHADAQAVMEHGLVRASLRAKEGRPPFSEQTLSALRSTRDAIDALLPAEPAAVPPPAADPPPVEPVAAKPAPVTPRFRSNDEWLHFLTERTPA